MSTATDDGWQLDERMKTAEKRLVIMGEQLAHERKLTRKAERRAARAEARAAALAHKLDAIMSVCQS